MSRAGVAPQASEPRTCETRDDALRCECGHRALTSNGAQVHAAHKPHFCDDAWRRAQRTRGPRTYRR